MDMRVILFALPIAGGLLASCDDRETGSFFEQSSNNLAQWSANNPDASDQTWANVETLNCKLSGAQICGPQGCKSGKPLTYVRWHPNSKKYQRCGGTSPCDDYVAQVSYSGAWVNIAVPDRSIMARLSTSGQFLEVLTQMDTVFVYHGRCQAEGQGAG